MTETRNGEQLFREIIDRTSDYLEIH